MTTIRPAFGATLPTAAATPHFGHTQQPTFSGLTKDTVSFSGNIKIAGLVNKRLVKSTPQEAKAAVANWVKQAQSGTGNLDELEIAISSQLFSTANSTIQSEGARIPVKVRLISAEDALEIYQDARQKGPIPQGVSNLLRNRIASLTDKKAIQLIQKPYEERLEKARLLSNDGQKIESTQEVLALRAELKTLLTEAAAFPTNQSDVWTKALKEATISTEVVWSALLNGENALTKEQAGQLLKKGQPGLLDSVARFELREQAGLPTKPAVAAK